MGTKNKIINFERIKEKNIKKYSKMSNNAAADALLAQLLAGDNASGSASQSYQFSSGSAGASGSVNTGFASSASTGFASSSASGSNNITTDLLALVNGSSSGSASGSASYSASTGAVLSEIEQLILRSTNPIDVNETEELTVIGQRGVWLNKAEVNAWRGDLAITEYRIHEDANPQVITKKVQQQVEYVQELAIRYLRPPTPPAPGEIIITQEANTNTGPAPPLIIRQAAARADTPEPLVVREAPPQPPAPVGPKRITISGKKNPPPPRKVVIERLAPLPSKPQNVIVERWLPYAETKRRVVFNKAAEVKAEVATPRNVIVQWEAPSVNVRKEVKYLGVIKANPAEYVQRYGAELKVHTALPQFVLDIKTPSEVGQLAADHQAKGLYELEGQLEGFQFVNLDTEGLAEYREQLLAKGIRDLGAGSSSASASASSGVAAAAGQVFDMIDTDRSGEISIDEAMSIVLRLNSQLKRSYGETEVKAFFKALSGGSENITKSAFSQGFAQLAA